jgi:hypothetical protein
MFRSSELFRCHFAGIDLALNSGMIADAVRAWLDAHPAQMNGCLGRRTVKT